MPNSRNHDSPLKVLLLAVPETAGSALYGMLDVLAATGSIWETLVGEPVGAAPFDVRVIAPRKTGFTCGNGIPVRPDVTIDEDPPADILVLPELWLGPDEHLKGRYRSVMAFIRRKHERGGFIYSACSGSIMLAASGLLSQRPATSHWGYADLFRTHYPDIDFQPEPNLCFADDEGRIVTAGGTMSWHDLATHIIARHVSPGEALRIAKVYLLKWHGEGQLPYAPLLKNRPHADAVVANAEAWLSEHFREPEPVGRVTAALGIPERSLKRRFRGATGQTLIQRVQNLRIEEAKRCLESSSTSIDNISAAIGYEDAAFFRRLFKRLSGVSPSEYRRMFGAMPGRRPPLSG